MRKFLKKKKKKKKLILKNSKTKNSNDFLKKFHLIQIYLKRKKKIERKKK
jgi:hypothetical protein